jgi:zinc and cadmium transporter
MTSIWTVLFFSIVGGLFSLIGGFLLVAGKKHTLKVAMYATPFAAGALLAAAFIDLLPEAAHEGNIDTGLLFTLIGILLFFLLERFLRWFHHHHKEEDSHQDPRIPLIIIGDTVHNFIDGIAIAAGFLVDTPTGIAVTIAVAAHEIPQEIGDFGLLLNKGMPKNKVILVNILSALATSIAAVLFYSLGQNFEIRLDVVLGLVAGFFIYIAVSDIIPEIHRNEDQSIAGPQTLLLILGVIIVGLTTTILHGYTEVEEDDHHSSGINSIIVSNHGKN